MKVLGIHKGDFAAHDMVLRCGIYLKETQIAMTELSNGLICVVLLMVIQQFVTYFVIL